MVPIAESLESRCLFSTTLAAGAKLVFATPPHSATADDVSRERVVVDLVSAAGRRITRSNPFTVTLRIASGPDVGTALGTLRLSRGQAIFRKLAAKTPALHKVGAYTLDASIDQPLDADTLAISPPITISQGAAAHMTVSGDSLQDYSGTAYFEATLYDQFGNLATNDRSYITIWHNDDSQVGIDTFAPIGSAIIYSPQGSPLGPGFVNGVADFSVQANGGPRTVSVIFADSNPNVNHVRSIGWLAHL